MQKQPRVQDKRYLQLIRTMPCVVSGRHGVEAAHVRYGSPADGKRATGMQEKPDDRWVLPLTPELHRTSNDAQHAGSEIVFWRRHKIDPLVVCREAYEAYKNSKSAIEAEEAVNAVLMRHRMFRK